MNYSLKLEEETRRNEDFRRVLHTGERSQVVAMAIPPGGDIGEEVHDHVEQLLVIVEGTASAVVDGAEVSAASGDMIVVPPGKRHNVVNSGATLLKLYTIYTPPNHIDGRIHHTKADAEADLEDEAFGHAAYEGGA